MKDPADRRTLSSLGDRIKRARTKTEADGQPQAGAASSPLLGMAWRLAVELVTAPAVCGYIGWVLDQWLGSKPWFFLGFLLLGLITGGVLAYRSMQEMIRHGERMAGDGQAGGPPSPGAERE